MSRFRQVPGIAQGPKGFSPASFVPMQSPLEQAPVDGIAEQLQDLAMEIYCRLVSKHIAPSVGFPDEPERRRQLLSELAQASQQAALAYFQQLGVQFEGESSNG